MEDEPDPGRESGYHPERFGSPLLLSLLLSASSPAALLVVAGGCLALAFVCALFENALQHFSRVRLTAEAKQRGMEETLDASLLREDEILFDSKVGRGFFQTVSVATLVIVLVQAGPSSLAAAGWAISIALLFLLVMVAVPSVIARRLGDTILLRWLIPYSRFILLLRPFSAALQKVTERCVGMGNGKPPDPTEEITDEILSAVEEGTREGSIEPTEKRMIEGVIDLRDVAADHIMTPRTEMVCLPLHCSAEEAIERASGRGLSRLPVYRETPDDIIGILYVKDLLPYLGKQEPPPIESILRKPFFIPQSKNVGDLLQEMRRKRVHLAVVLDEYGGTAGVVTIEDILEEIVGEIVDEHETAAPSDVVLLNENAATVEGRTHIDDLNRSLDLEVPESEEYETIGGLIFSRMGRVPATGEQVDLDGIRFTILEADERRINRVKVAVRRR